MGSLGSVYSRSHQVIFDRIKTSFGPLYLARLDASGKETLDIQVVEKREKQKHERRV